MKNQTKGIIGNTVNTYNRGYQQGRKDAIDEIDNKLRPLFCYCSDYNPKCSYCDLLDKIAKEMQ